MHHCTTDSATAYIFCTLGSWLIFGHATSSSRHYLVSLALVATSSANHIQTVNRDAVGGTRTTFLYLRHCLLSVSLCRFTWPGTCIRSVHNEDFDVSLPVSAAEQMIDPNAWIFFQRQVWSIPVAPTFNKIRCQDRSVLVFISHILTIRQCF